MCMNEKPYSSSSFIKRNPEMAVLGLKRGQTKKIRPFGLCKFWPNAKMDVQEGIIRDQNAIKLGRVGPWP